MSKTYYLRDISTIKFLRGLADKIESGEFEAGHGYVVERKTKGRKYIKFTGLMEIKFWLKDTSIEGKSSDEDVGWPPPFGDVW